MGKQPEAPDVVAERARLVFTTLVSPTVCACSHLQLLARMVNHRVIPGLQR